MQNGGIQLRVSDLLFAIQKRWKIIVALTFIGGVLGLLLTGMTYIQSTLTTYSISGTFVVTTKNADGKYLYGDEAASQNDFNTSMDMAEPVLFILRSDRVINDIINKQELLGVSASDIRKNLTTSIYNASMIVTMTLNWVSDTEGMTLWNALIDTTNEVLPQTLQFGRLEVLDHCTATSVSAGGSGRTMPVFLALLGFGAGLGFAVMELLMHPTLTNVKDMESTFGLEIIGQIPRDDRFFRRQGSLLVQNQEGSSEVLQSFSAAAYILRNRLGSKEKPLIFYITSAAEQEGRSTIAANLGIQFSDMEQKTLLVDCNVKNPTLGSLFMNTVDYEHSLNALYRGETREQDAVTTLTGYLDLLPMVLEHNPIPMDSMVLELIQKIAQGYDYVILDAPPVGKEADTLSLNEIASMALFVTGYDQASIPEIQAALEKLDKSGIRVLGCVINNVQGTRYRSTDGKNRGRRKRKAAPEEAPKSREPELPLIRREKKEKKAEKAGGAGEKEASGADSARERPAEPAPSAVTPSRNIMEDLERTEKKEDSMSVQDTLSALYRMGLEGSREPEKEAGENGKKPEA